MLLRRSAAPIHTRSFVVSLVVRALLVLSGCRILKKLVNNKGKQAKKRASETEEEEEEGGQEEEEEEEEEKS